MTDSNSQSNNGEQTSTTAQAPAKPKISQNYFSGRFADPILAPSDLGSTPGDYTSLQYVVDVRGPSGKTLVTVVVDHDGQYILGTKILAMDAHKHLAYILKDHEGLKESNLTAVVFLTKQRTVLPETSFVAVSLDSDFSEDKLSDSKLLKVIRLFLAENNGNHSSVTRDIVLNGYNLLNERSVFRMMTLIQFLISNTNQEAARGAVNSVFDASIADLKVMRTSMLKNLGLIP